MDDAARTWANLSLKGDIDLGVPGGAHAHLTAARFRMDGDAAWVTRDVRLELEGTLGELRKLATLGATYRAMLDLAAVAPDDALGRLILNAPRGLVEDMARAAATLPEDALPNQWLEHAPWATLAFALDRYEPIGVSVTQQMA